MEPFSTLDFPGRLAMVVFLQGCPLACGYCHNPDLIPASADGLVPFAEVLDALDARAGFVEAAVFSGGEPLAQAALRPGLEAVRARGLLTGLHTAGTNPSLLRDCLALVDWVGFDVKAPFDRYGPATGVAAMGAKARESLEALAASGRPFEARTTVQPGALDAADLERIAFALRQTGVARYVLQEARTPDRKPWPGGSPLDDAGLVAGIAAMFDSFEVRRAQS